VKIDNSPPRGTRDLLPDTVAVRDHVLATISEVYHRYGYRRIETPALEDIRRLQGGDGGENEKLIFQVLRRGLDDRIDGPTPIADLVDLGLRFDLTVPLTRFYGNNHATLPVPFRSFQFAPVWRAERPQKGRYRQFYQCDIDLIGDETVLAEAELIEATTQALDAIGLSDTTVRHHRPTPPSGTTVRLSDRRFLSALAAHAGLDEQSWAGFFISLDKLDKIGWDGVCARRSTYWSASRSRCNLVALVYGPEQREGVHPGGVQVQVHGAPGGDTGHVRQRGRAPIVPDLADSPAPRA
jgi:histidyl-tRNA synthetase